MGRRRISIYVMIVFLLIVALLVEMKQVQWAYNPFSVVIETELGSQSIDCISLGNGKYGVFLPSYVNLDDITFQSDFFSSVWIDDRPIKNGMSCGWVPLDESLPMTWKMLGKSSEKTLFFKRSDNVAALYINVASGSMEYIHQKKGNAESGNLCLYTPDGMLDSCAQISEIYGRGNSTWLVDEKKPYGFELTMEADLLEMGTAKRWILLANWFDKSNICNKMSYQLAADAGAAYSPKCEWVDLYLNGNYRGLYLLTERNEIHPQRIAIDEDNSFLISMELEQRAMNRNYASFTSAHNTFMRIHQAGMPVQRVQDIWQSVENAIFAEDGIDYVTGKHWQELIDLDSWVHQFLLAETLVDYDASAWSKYFYYDANTGKVYAGPIWDMDNILDIRGLQPFNCLSASRQYVHNRDNESIYYALYMREEFFSRLMELYEQVYRPLLVDLQENGMYAFSNRIRQAADMNRIRWGAGEPITEMERMRAYLKERVEFLDTYWRSKENFCIIQMMIDGYWQEFAVRRGDSAEFIRTLRGYEDAQWYDDDTGEPFDLTLPVTRNWIIQTQEWEE